jgi:hypothetical protein
MGLRICHRIRSGANRLMNFSSIYPDNGSEKTANLTYGQLPGALASNVIVQRFQSISASDALIATPRRHGLPPPDSLSLGEQAPPK